MDVKMIEIRDRATFIPAIAIRLRNRTPREFYLLRRAGYSREQIGGPEEIPGKLAHGLEPYVLLMKADGDRVQYDPYSWADRTFRTAHMHLIEHWHEVESGAVVDVQFILGETIEPKQSEEVTVG